MTNGSESVTHGIVTNKFHSFFDYSNFQNIEQNGIVWFHENSYKGSKDDWLTEVFAKATKKQSMTGKGTPDFTVIKRSSDVVVVIECKPDVKYHSVFKDVNEYKTHGYGTPEDTQGYAINGALYYATFLCDRYDVIATAVSGQSEAELKVTSFVLPKGGRISDIELVEDGGFVDALVSINEYENSIEAILGRYAATEKKVRDDLRRYTLHCANFLRANGIEDNSKAGFISAIILGLTNKDSRLYKDTVSAIERKRAAKSRRMAEDTLGRESVKLLKDSLYGNGKDEYEDGYVKGIWDIDKIPKGKQKSLKKFYDILLGKDELTKAPKNQGDYFKDGNTVLSCCIYSIYQNVIDVIEHYKGIDVMGEFYTTFLRFTKGNAKEKGIVLTPKHITELFCDIAEYYGGKFDENTRIIDTCCGTGAFLISSLERIKKNLDTSSIALSVKEDKYRDAQINSLIGVERDASMYALAYANMRFHGKSNLYNCSSLLYDSFAPVDDSGYTYYSDSKKVKLAEALKNLGEIHVGMINPPYSLDKNDDNVRRNYPTGTSPEVELQQGQSELDFIASMLYYLKKDGIGIAIVPMSCAGNSGTALREKILDHHTLLACMTMPRQLFFDSHIGQCTCIMVFKAHCPHDEDKAVFFARWTDDGFVVIPHNGRKDYNGLWESIRKKWMDELDGVAEPDDKVFMRKKIKKGDEALAEAYIKTDYSKLTDDNFEQVLKKYALFKYMDSNVVMED